MDNFREDKETFFATDPHSPLLPAQKKGFKGLNYFPEAPELRFELPVERFKDQETIQIQTSTGDIQQYVKYGKIRFPVEGQEVAMTIYADGDEFFMPFVDSLAGKETYPAGRYLDPEQMEDGRPGSISTWLITTRRLGVV